MIIFNAIGVGIGFLALIVTSIANQLFAWKGVGDWRSLVMLGVIALLPDIVLRLRRRSEEGWKALGLPTCGGHIFFVPMWVWGVIFVGAGGLKLLGVKW